MKPALVLSFDLGAAALIALWVIVRFPRLGPRSLLWAMAGFIAGQVAPSIGLVAVEPVLRFPHGLILALVGVVLPVFCVMFLTAGWLFRAVLARLGGPRGGHPVTRHLAGSEL